jgi:ABC-type multidrug transport system fused ATPase/permease subunit
MVAANVRLRANMDHISSMLQERLSAHELIQAYGQEKAEATQFSSQAKQVMDSAIRGSAYNISFNQLSAFINKIGNTLIYGAGCYFFVKEAMGYGDVVAFCAYATQILGPVVRFTTVANQIVQAGVSVDRIQEILDREPAIMEVPEPKPVESLRGDVDVSGVRFAYDDGPQALDGIDLKIPGGSHVAIVGPPGAGRSTLAMLIRRFFDPAEGRIRVDGIDIREYRLDDYRRALALVPSECAIFDGTIRENLCYGRPDAPKERMIEVARQVGLHDFVMSLEDGYETRLGTGGLRLATGNRQRIGVARALIAEPSVLIVDEATAALDPESAEQLSSTIRDAMGGRTYLFVAHRVLLAKDADRIVVMDNGRIVDSGSHEELVCKPDSLYRELFAIQYGEHRLPPARTP